MNFCTVCWFPFDSWQNSKQRYFVCRQWMFFHQWTFFFLLNELFLLCQKWTRGLPQPMGYLSEWKHSIKSNAHGKTAILTNCFLCLELIFRLCILNLKHSIWYIFWISSHCKRMFRNIRNIYNIRYILLLWMSTNWTKHVPFVQLNMLWFRVRFSFNQ